MRGSNDPFERMEAMFEQMRRSAVGSAPDWDRPDSPEFGRSDGRLPVRGTHDAALTLEETNDGYIVAADLPGFEREEIGLTYDDGVLRIEGAHEVSGEEAYRKRTVAESVRIPGDVVRDEIAATYRNGVLEVVLPVDENQSEGYRIDVE